MAKKKTDFWLTAETNGGKKKKLTIIGRAWKTKNGIHARVESLPYPFGSCTGGIVIIPDGKLHKFKGRL